MLKSKSFWIKIVLVVVLYLLLHKYFGYLNFPVPVYMGGDWDRHFSWFNYLIDVVFWGAIFYFIYRFVKPALKIKKILLISLLLTVIVTTVTLIFGPLVDKTIHNTGLRIREINNQNSGLVCNSREDTYRGLPYAYYHRWFCYDINNRLVWDYIEIEDDYLLLDAIVWFVLSAALLRLINRRSSNF